MQIPLKIEGFVKISDPNTGEILVDKKNAIHYENISYSLAEAFANQGKGTVYVMAFGNGGSTVDDTGVITYLPPNTVNQNADLYHQTYQKVVDQSRGDNTDPAHNYITVNHLSGRLYTDLVITALLDYGEPLDQQAFDNATQTNGAYIFDEIAIKTFEGTGANPEDILTRLITHVIFHPVQKSLNRQIQIEYTIRLQSLTNLSQT